MTFTMPSEQLLSVDRLNLVFNLRHRRQRTLKAAFVEFSRSPIDALLRPSDSLHVLKDIQFSVSRGDRLAILGVNGGGKTSLCRAIAGMIHPNSGKITRYGSCRAVFDTSVGIIPVLTGRENAKLLARLTYPGESDRALELIVREAIVFSELGSFLDVPFETYSQGMKSRLFLSVITAKPADLLILDEVYDNTDQFFQKKMALRLMECIHTSGAVIFISHSAEHVRNICNRALVLNESRLAYNGPVEKALEVYEFLNEGRNKPEEKEK